jgi:hypothetical protein
VLLEVEVMGRLNGSRDEEETLVLCRFTIKLLFFLAKVRKIVDFLLKHRDLNPIGSRSSRQKPRLDSIANTPVHQVFEFPRRDDHRQSFGFENLVVSGSTTLTQHRDRSGSPEKEKESQGQ